MMTESSSRRELPTAESLPDHLFRLALPVLGEQLLVFSIDSFDVYLAGQIGTAETSAIGLAAYVVWMASLIMGLVRTGVGALVARAWGGGDRAAAREITSRGFFLGFFLCLFVWQLLRALAPVFAGSLTMTGDAHAIAANYIRWAALGQVFQGVTLIGTAALRATGDMRTPLAILAVTNVINMVAATACVYGWGPVPKMGVTGIVTGTVIAQAVSMILMLLALSHGVTRLQLIWSEVRLHRDTATRILRVGGPSALDGLLKFSGH
ncbi:MAG TPA: MATE family efflux transporter, partial [Planctomycetaceae bacterium]|nr:MATE family efflux transporter [Planctomycetaceae bacterium]